MIEAAAGLGVRACATSTPANRKARAITSSPRATAGAAPPPWPTASGRGPAQPARADRRPRHGVLFEGRRACGVRYRVDGEVRAASPARGAAVRRRAAIAAAAAAVRGRAGGAAAPARHRRGARPAGRGREPAGPSADPADLQTRRPITTNDQLRTLAGRARIGLQWLLFRDGRWRSASTRAACSAAWIRPAPRRTRSSISPRCRPTRPAARCIRSRAAPTGVPVAAQLARPCAAAQRRSLRGPVHAAELPVHRAGPPHGGGCGQIRAPAGGRRAAGRADETRVPARPRGARRRRDPALLPRIRRHHLSSRARPRWGRPTIRWRWWTSGCACAAWPGCAWSTARSCRRWCRATRTPVIMLAERAAEFILQEQSLPATPGAASLEACTRTGEAGATAAR